MNELKIFKNEEFGEVRTVTINGEPWFVGKDIAEILGYERGTKAIADHVDEEDREMIDGKTQSQFGIQLGQRGGWIINESGLYSLILSSKLESAKKFKHWVTSEVLPSIRKHGMYATDELLDNPDLLISVATALKAEREKNKLLEQEVEQKQSKIETLKPLADYTSIILSNKCLVNISQIAKDYGTSGNKMNEKLHKMHIQYKQGHQWLLYSEYQDKGYTHSITEIYQEGLTKMRTKWTQLGRMFIYEKLKEEGILPLIEQEYEDEL